MSERRRSLFVLLIVAALIGGSLAVALTRPTRLGLDLQGGVQLVYHAQPTAQQRTVDAESMARSIDLMQQRVNSFGVSEAELFQAGQDQIEVNLPGVRDAERAAQQVGSTAQLFFYDWEANILDDKCKTNPDLNANQRQPISGLRTAVAQASKCKRVGTGAGSDPLAENSTGGPSQAAAKPRFYAFDKKTKKPLNGGQTYDTRRQALDGLKAPEKTSAQILEVPAGVLVLRVERASPDAPKPDRWWVIQDRPGLSGNDIRSPEQSFDQSVNNEPIVTFNFSDKGRKAFQAITRRVAQRGADNALGGDPLQTSQHFAIALDNELVSAPYINWRENPDGIDGATGAQISGSFTITSAQDLAKILKIGALPLKLSLVSRSQVSATLGKQALDQGLKAGIAGFVIVALFLIFYYRVLGVVATLALCIYALYFYAIVKLIPITLTLPGIAGLVLTLGVAADANIVVFERVKEEVRAGRSIGVSIVTGYRKGLTAIIDANIVTFLVAFILFIIATAGVQGFAFTLGIGVIVSLFTAVLATQAILYSLRGARIIRSKAALGAGEQRLKFGFDFMARAKWFFSLSGCILLIAALAMSAKGINFGIDFEGGTRFTTALEKPATVEQVRTTLAPLGLKDAKIQTLSNPELGKNVVQVSTKELGPEGIDAAEKRLADAFGIKGQAQEESIGPSFGKTVARSAIYAIIASLLIISIYIALRFEWKFAVPVLIALMHDILIVAGVYALVGREVTTSTVAALLTILGYSLYDTIIVFDRIRENVPRMPSAAFSQIVNRSLSRGHRPLARDELLHAAAGARADAVRRRDAARLRVCAADRHRLRHVFLDLHRDAGAPALEGARAGLPCPPRAHPRDARARPGLRHAGAGRADRRHAKAAQRPPARDVAARDGGLAERVPGDGARARGRRRQAERAPAGRGVRAGPVGGRRARARANGAVTPPSAPPAPASGADDPVAKERKPRNKRHGRPR